MWRRLTTPHSDTANVFLSQEVPDLDQGAALLDDHVDGEMGVHGTHFVPETLQWHKSMRGKQNWCWNNRQGQPEACTGFITGPTETSISELSPKWLPWSCSGRGCRWCGLWPTPSCFPTIYPHEAEEKKKKKKSTAAQITCMKQVLKQSAHMWAKYWPCRPPLENATTFTFCSSCCLPVAIH